MGNVSYDELQKSIGHIQDSPANAGLVEMIVIRPDTDERSVVPTAELVVGEGLAGDNYVARGDSNTSDGSAHPEAQVTIMNSRALDAVTEGDRERWPLAGDQLLVDMDLSGANLPPGTRLAIGSAVLEISAKPHTGCAKFARRFGLDATKWANSDADLKLRGVNAKVVVAGTCSVGDVVTKI